MPIIHGFKLPFCVGQFDRQGVVSILRRDDMMMHVDAPILFYILAQVDGVPRRLQ
jgi:hypothetical protein